ncbi:Cyclin N-terminal domain-containing protein [Mycena venus]|uniref:Cyclin N-terminal domain-containing protein n=1 Tax=Mycena venus TaxID=2733690 RepID=A0A8H6XH09_9AGAR|nr:Cyclin N-terminal domain-containing protein [Mycena venus]
MNSPQSSDSSSAYSSWTPSTSKTNSSSPVHPASLVDPSTHSPELMQLLDIDLSQPVIEYVVSCVQETVDHALRRPAGSRSPRSHKFTTFVSNVLSRAEVAPATLLVALVYITRARPHISIALEQWALERVFLGALVVASKYTQDSTLKNVHWALITGLFSKRDVGRVEREFLDVLDWELGVTEVDILAHHEGLVGADVSPSWARVAAKPELRPSVVALSLSPTSAALPRARALLPHTRAPAASPRAPLHTWTSTHPRTPPSPSPLSFPAPAPSPASARPPTTPPAPTKNARNAHGHTRRKLRDLLHAFPFPFHHDHTHGHHAVEVVANIASPHARTNSRSAPLTEAPFDTTPALATNAPRAVVRA